MNTRKLRKIILTLCSALLLVSLSVGITVAYLTSETEVVKNTFTVGTVKITLDEARTDVEGKVIEGDRRLFNEYKLLPGHTYTKDPTVHVKAGSEECYLFVKVVNGIEAIEDKTATIESQIIANNWVEYAAASADDYTVYYYKTTVKPAADKATDVPVFANFKIDGTVEKEVLATYATAANETANIITIDAYAIQADGFASAEAAWTAQAANWNGTAN